MRILIEYPYRILLFVYGILFAVNVIPMTSLCVFILVFIAANAASEAGRDYAVAAARRPWDRV